MAFSQKGQTLRERSHAIETCYYYDNVELCWLPIHRGRHVKRGDGVGSLLNMCCKMMGPEHLHKNNQDKRKLEELSSDSPLTAFSD